jgi:hypothetical protein
MHYSFDTRALILAEDTQAYDPAIAEQAEANKRLVREGLIHGYGADDYERKIGDFAALGPAAWSVVARHNVFLQHIRIAFVAGGYYASLVASGTLGERILNQLILTMRADFTCHPATEKVVKKGSFENWPPAVKVLYDWGVIDADTEKQFPFHPSDHRTQRGTSACGRTVLALSIRGRGQRRSRGNWQ